MFKIHRTFGLASGVKNNSIAVFSDAKQIQVIYHSTVVVSATYGRGRWTVKLNSGGWPTVSTAIVMTTALRQIPGFDCYFVNRKGGLLRLNDSKPLIDGEVLVSRGLRVA